MPRQARPHRTCILAEAAVHCIEKPLQGHSAHSRIPSTQASGNPGQSRQLRMVWEICQDLQDEGWSLRSGIAPAVCCCC